MSAIEDALASGLLRERVDLGSFTTYKAGGPADYFAELRTGADLEQLIATGLPAEMPILIVGRGSNLLISDEGFAGVAVHLQGDFNMIRINDEVWAGGAYPLPRLARESVSVQLRGLEFFVGVPGSVGGAVRQNAGCFGSETKDVLVRAEIVDLHSGIHRQSTPESLELSYRHSNIASHELVTSAVFAATSGDPEEGKTLMREITRWRKENQPGGTLNAGSVFKNPPDRPAGALIDSLGLKGTRVGGVSVSHKHANFFVADSTASASDIRELVQVVSETVEAETGIRLETEIQFVGFDK